LTQESFKNVGNFYTPIDNATIVNNIPIGIYSVVKTPVGFAFEKEGTEFTIPTKVYGEDYSRRLKKVLKTFNDRNNTTTGVLLTGDTGSGKTLLAKNIAKEANLPIIKIDGNDCVEKLLFVSSETKFTCVILFDEFEKNFTNDAQEAILSVLDGMYSRKALMIFTSNSQYLSSCIINRPGRIFYHFKFGKVSESFITDYCNDVLNDKTYIPKIIDASKVINDNFSFDVLKAIVEDCNRFGGDIKDIIEDLNIHSMMGREYESYSVIVRDSKGRRRFEKVNNDIVNTVMLSNDNSFRVYLDSSVNTKKSSNKDLIDEEESDSNEESVKIRCDKVTKILNGKFYFEFEYNGEEYEVELTKVQSLDSRMSFYRNLGAY
jgi:SpoVK/Ycf46/Vps4 family AAA+-type ATPase